MFLTADHDKLCVKTAMAAIAYVQQGDKVGGRIICKLEQLYVTPEFQTQDAHSKREHIVTDALWYLCLCIADSLRAGLSVDCT